MVSYIDGVKSFSDEFVRSDDEVSCVRYDCQEKRVYAFSNVDEKWYYASYVWNETEELYWKEARYNTIPRYTSPEEHLEDLALHYELPTYEEKLETECYGMNSCYVNDDIYSEYNNNNRFSL